MSGVRTIRFWRRLCQCCVVLGFVLIPFMNMRDITAVSGNFLSFNAFGLSFVDPLAAVQAMTGESFAPAMLFGAGLVLVIALLLGRIFCSWLCPYGLASELLHSFRKAATGKAVPLAENQPEGQRQTAMPPLSVRPFTMRVLVCVVGLAAVLLVSSPWLNQLSMPGWYSRALQHGVFFSSLLYGALSLPAMLLLEAALRQRLWCRYLCPQSILLALAAGLPAFLRVRFNRKQCTCPRTDRACMPACSLALNPRAPTALQRIECTNCGDCVDACRSRGKALSFAVREKQL